MKKNAYLLIAISLVFAALIICSGWLIRDPSAKSVVSNLLIAAWWIPFAFFLSRQSSCGRNSCEQ
jgi:hypothetical protein